MKDWEKPLSTSREAGKEKVTEFLVRHEKIKNDWKQMQGEREEMEGLMLIHQAGINDNDYHVVMGMCGEDRSYENVWRSLKRIFGGRKDK